MSDIKKINVNGTLYDVAGGGGETPHLYEIKVGFQDDLIELVCLSTEPIDNLMDITDSTVITDDIWNSLVNLKDKIYDVHLRTTSDSALLSGGDIYFSVNSETHEVNGINFWVGICYADAETQNYNVSGQEGDSINITKEEGQGYQVSCDGNRTPRNITCRQIF